MNRAEELYEQFEPIFKEQLDLEISEAIELNNNKDGYVLKIDKLALSMASLGLQLTPEEHGDIADFLQLANLSE